MSTNNPNGGPPDIPPEPHESEGVTPLGRMLVCLLALVALGGAGVISAYWLMNKPKSGRKRRAAQATLVEVVPVVVRSEQVSVSALGTVVPARSVKLAARVGGEIIYVDARFVPGGHFKANDRLLQIEPRDYELVEQQRLSDLAKAQSDLKLEFGRQSVAKREYKLLGEEVREEDRELVLRQPQLLAAQAAVSAAQAALDKARLELKRTAVTAPFNAMIRFREVELGAQVATGGPVASLVGTDKYWVRVSLPVDQLKWVDIPGTNSQRGSTVRVYHKTAWGAGVFRTGVVELLMSELEPQGRMTRLLVAVDDPMQLTVPLAKRRPLILDSYVRVEIQGRGLKDIVRVDRTALRDGNRVWVMKPDNTLDIREVQIVWSGKDHVCVSGGLREGDRLVVSDLGAPVEGMALRTADSPQDEPTTRPAEKTKKGPRREAKP